MIKPEHTHKTQADIARTYTVTPQCVTAWLRHADFPAKGAGGWSVRDVAGWVEGLAKRKAARAVSGDLKQEKLRLECGRLVEVTRREKTLADREQAAAAAEAGRMVTIETHTRDLLRLVDILVDGLRTFEERVASTTRDARLMQLVQDHVRQLRTELSATVNACDETSCRHGVGGANAG